MLLSFKERRLRITSCWCFSRIFFGSHPSCHTTTLQTKHTQIQDTLVANSHACFKETALKTLKPILRQHLQEYKIYRAPSLHFIKVQAGTPPHPSYTLPPMMPLKRHKRHFYSFFVKFHSTRAHLACNVRAT